ncbi:MAG: hypothetical protein ABSA48_00865 [Terracidiphilus sp.]|jgi:hypothetical protein
MWRFHARSAAFTTIFPILIAFPAVVLAQENRPPAGVHEQGLVLVEQYPSPVLTVKSPGAEENKYGFEGGNVVKLQGTYHLVTTEMTGDPFWVKTKLAHWSSNDRIHWKRVSTLYESSGEHAGKDPRAALWGPMFIYDEQSQEWNLVYVAYRSAPNTATEFRTDYEGVIWRAVSKVKGPAGIDGPYTDAGVLLRPDKDSQPWEGLLGTDSFFAYQAGDRWLGFYGSANTEVTIPALQHTLFGLAEAPRLAGPWKRSAGTNPVNVEKQFAENPIVSRLEDGSYLAVFDNNYPNAIGYTWSADGLHWMPGRSLVVQTKGKGFWADDVRTPLGLVAEGNGLFTLFYTGYQKPPGSSEKNMPGTPEMGFGAIGFVTVRLQTQN